jgi:TatD DNase family protein
MTAGHASRIHLDTMPATLRALYFPPTVKPERFKSGMPVKGRNEPSAIGGVAWVVHQLHHEMSYEQVTQKVWMNTVRLFGLHELTYK